MNAPRVTYQIQYQLGNGPVGPKHRTLAAAWRHSELAEWLARKGGDSQNINIVRSDGEPLTAAEEAEMDRLWADDGGV